MKRSDSAPARLVVLAFAMLLLAGTACAPSGTPEDSQAEDAQSEAAAPAAPQAPEAVRLTVPQGTEIQLTLNQDVSSGTSQVGDTFTATTANPIVVGDRVALPAGSVVHGRVTEVVPAKKGLKEKEGALSLSFESVVPPGGRKVPMEANLASVAPKSTKKTAGIIGGSAAGGAILGKVLGNDNKDAAVGAVIGGAIGTGIAAGTKGEDVEIPAGSQITIHLEQSLAVTVKP